MKELTVHRGDPCGKKPCDKGAKAAVRKAQGRPWSFLLWLTSQTSHGQLILLSREIYSELPIGIEDIRCTQHSHRAQFLLWGCLWSKGDPCVPER